MDEYILFFGFCYYEDPLLNVDSKPSEFDIISPFEYYMGVV
jgi:hypothetical protein